MNFMKTYARDGSMVTNLTPDRINTQEEFKSYYKEVFETIYTLDYLQGKVYLELTPAQQSAITSQHRYGTTNNYQSRNQSNSTWRTIGAAELENMNLKTLDDLWDNQLTIRPGHRFDLRSMNDVGVNNLGAYQIDRVCYASWYVPYVDGGTPNAQTFRRNGYELGGLYGYSDGLVEYLSNRTQTGDLAYFKKKMQDENFSFETYRKNKNKEIEEKIKKQKEQGNAYFDEEALIEYLKQNMINYGNGINSGVSTGNNTLNNIKESRENVFRYLQRITDEFRSPVYADTAESRHAVTISTGQELIEKINENPNGFYVLEKDISMADINLTGEVYIDKTFIGKLQGNGHKITDAQGPLFAKIANSYVAGWCAMWVSQVYQNAGLGYIGGNACDMYRNYTFTSDKSKLKVGMLVAVESSSSGSTAGLTYGHVGIYIGDGKVIDNIGRIRVTTLDDWIASFCQHHPVGFGFPPNVNR